MSKKIRLDRKIGFQNMFYTKCTNVIIDSIGPSIILRSIFIMLINVKMPTIVGILTFISMIKQHMSFKARKVFIFQHFSFYEQLKYHAQLN